MFLWSSWKIKFMTGCLPQYYLGKCFFHSFYTFHSLLYSPVVFLFSVQRFWFGLLLWGICGVFFLRFCCLVVGFLMLVFICILSLGVLCVCVCLGFCCGFWYLWFWFIWGFCFTWLGFWFLSTLCLVPPNEAWGVDLEFFFFWFNDFHQLKDMWKVPAVLVPENWKEILKLVWPCFVDTIILRAC